MSTDDQIICQRTGENGVAFAVKLNGNLLELRVGKVNGDYVHQLMIDREEAAKDRRPVPFWDEPFEMNVLTVDILIKMAQQAMEEGVLEMVCRDCREAVNGHPFVRCEACGWFFCPDCHSRFTKPTRCWKCWTKELLNITTEYIDQKGQKKPCIDKERMAKESMSWFRVLRFVDGRDHTYWIYDHREEIWKPNGEEKIEKFFYNTLGRRFAKGTKSYLMGYIRATCTVERENVLTVPTDLIPVLNGFVNWRTGKLVRGLDPSIYYFTKRHPIRFDPSAKCERFLQFLETAVTTDDERRTLIEWLGYNLLREFPLHKFIVLYGVGANGKSTYTSALKTVLGAEFCSGIDIFQLADNRFAPSNLFEKNANIHSDVGDGPIKNTSMLKTLTGDDLVSVEKKRRDHFEFVNYAKLTFSSNHVLDIRDHSPGLRRRPMVVEFPNQFEEDPEYKRLLLEEAAGIFNLALGGLRELMEAGKFSLKRTYDDMQSDYIFGTNPLFRFCNWFLTEDPYGDVAVARAYAKYREFLDDEGGRAVGKSAFSKKLKERFPKIRTERLRDNDGKKKWFIVGIRLKPVDEQGGDEPGWFDK